MRKRGNKDTKEFEELKKDEVYKINGITFVKLLLEKKSLAGGEASITKMGGRGEYGTEEKSAWVAVASGEIISKIVPVTGEEQIKERMASMLTNASGTVVSSKDIDLAVYCDKCGNKLRPDASFCDQCGIKIHKIWEE